MASTMEALSKKYAKLNKKCKMRSRFGKMKQLKGRENLKKSEKTTKTKNLNSFFQRGATLPQWHQTHLPTSLSLCTVMDKNIGTSSKF